MKRLQISDHARHQMAERLIDLETVERVLHSPDDTIPAAKERHVAQKIIHSGGKDFIYRVIYVDEGATRTVITVYRTSKIGKYLT